MKKIIIVTCLSFLCMLGVLKSFGQNKPFMAFDLKSVHSKLKDASEWDKDQKVKNLALAVYIKSESGADEVKLIDYKTGKVENIISFSNTAPGNADGNTFITLDGGKDIANKACAVKIMYPTSSGGLQRASWIKISLTYDDQVMEYDAKYAK